MAPIPLILELIDKLLGARFFTKLNVQWEYNNIRICEGNKWKTAFKTPMGLYESLVMNFGLCNAPATFQTFMDDVMDSKDLSSYLYLYRLIHDASLIILLTICTTGPFLPLTSSHAARF